MGANNWDICPRCLHNATAALEQAKNELRDLYGKVSIEEFDRRRAELKPVQAEDFRTFGEWYEIGISQEEGAVTVDYSGQCRTCKLTAKLQKTEQFWKPGVA